MSNTAREVAKSGAQGQRLSDIFAAPVLVLASVFRPLAWNPAVWPRTAAKLQRCLNGVLVGVRAGVSGSQWLVCYSQVRKVGPVSTAPQASAGQCSAERVGRASRVRAGQGQHSLADAPVLRPQEHRNTPSRNPPSLDESLMTMRYTNHAHDIMVMSAV